MNIGENLKKIRLSRGLTQQELADAVGITKSMICQIERGTKLPVLTLSKDIADVLECSLYDFFDGGESRKAV